MTDERMYCIRVRKEDEKRSRLLGSGGRETTKKLHALQFTREQADKAASQLRADNPGFVFTVGTFWREARGSATA